MNKQIAYRDGLQLWTKGEVFTGPDGEVVEVLYDEQDEKMFFVELPGIPACAHGTTVEEAIDEAREKQEGTKPLSEEEKEQYATENFKFTVRLFRRITKACNAGIDQWLKERDLDRTVQMTLKEFRKAGGGQWADLLEQRIKE